MNIVQYVQIRRRDGRDQISARHIIAVVAACAVACALPIAARAQSTTARIFGQAPAGETVVAHSSAGLHRDAKANTKGRYSISSLPAGDYTVTLEKDGKTVDTQSNVALIVGRGAEVDFACPNDQCAAAENR
jgi:hypothetical protein